MPQQDTTANAGNTENLVCFANYLELADQNIHFISTCNHELLALSASAMELGESEQSVQI